MDVFINLLHFCPPWMRLDSTFCWNMGKVYYWHVSNWFYNRPLLIPFFVKVYQGQNHPVKDSLKITCGKLQVLEVMGTIISKVVQCMNQRLSKNSNSKSQQISKDYGIWPNTGKFTKISKDDLSKWFGKVTKFLQKSS